MTSKLIGKPLAVIEEELFRRRPAAKAAFWDPSLQKRQVALALVRLRRGRGLKQSDVAMRAGWDKAYVSRLEAALTGLPDLATLSRYAEACGMTVELVFGDMSTKRKRVIETIALRQWNTGADVVRALRAKKLPPNPQKALKSG